MEAGTFPHVLVASRDKSMREGSFREGINLGYALKECSSCLNLSRIPIHLRVGVDGPCESLPYQNIL